MVFWNSRERIENNYLLLVVIAYTFASVIDLVHTLAYAGMGVFPGYGPNLPTQLWIAARSLQSISLIIAPFSIGRKLKLKYVFISYITITSLLFGSIFYWTIFPDCYIEGIGLTFFKKTSEYVISLILFCALVLLNRRRSRFDDRVVTWLSFSIILTLFSELAFTFYVSVYGFSNLVGHLFKIVAFFLVYKAIIQVGVKEPFSLIFRELKESQKKLIKAERFALMSKLASVMALELRNALGVIKNSNFFLKMKLKDSADEKMKKHLEITGREIDYSNQIISDLLDFSRKRPPTLTETNLNEIVRNVLADSSRPADINVIMKLGEIPRMLLDQEQIRGVFQNIILNAVQAMPEGGKLTIQTLKRGDSVEIVFKDTGVGIPEENLPKLFTPLFSTKARGIGLGLAICKQIVDGHGGNITIESKEGKGTTFTVKLPIRVREEAGEGLTITVGLPVERRVKSEK